MPPPRGALDGQLGQLRLGVGQLLLHGLGLFHQGAEVFHRSVLVVVWECLVGVVGR
jgi:hypothetical protein